MNERIKELADEAAKFSAVMALPTGESGDKLFVEKLAELIVREAAQFVSGSAEVYTQAEQDACVRAAIGLKKYFGVLE